MTTSTITYYQISIENSGIYFSPESYTKYYQRMTLSHEGKLPEGEQTYGYEQALEHIEELRTREYEGKLQYKSSTFLVTTITSVRTSIPIKAKE